MFVVIEGIDGAGCETQALAILNTLKEKNLPHSFFKYPDYTRNIGPLIKEFLYQDKPFEVEAQTLFFSLQFAIDSPSIRKQTETDIVISDRYFSTTLCYQTIFGFPMKKLLRFASDFKIAVPDLIIFLDVEPKTAAKRKLGENKQKNWTEKDYDLTQKTYKQYKKLIGKQVWTQWVNVDASGSIDSITNKIFAIIQGEWKKRSSL